jgi:hypothetical protein
VSDGRAVPGVVPHVAPARLIAPDGTETPTFSRGLGRNRVALLVEGAPALGSLVRFSVLVDGGTVDGEGRVERLHTAMRVGGEERWVVIDVDRLDAGSQSRLLRVLYVVRLEEYATSADQERELPPPPPPKRRDPPPADAPKRPRPKVSRYEAPEVPQRWRVR